MAKLRFSVHPLFFLFGIYFAATGRIFVFLTYTCVAVIHETGHAMAAARLGYKLNRVVLMPYGAVISGDLKGLKISDEISVALAGPITNLACAALFAALWWVFPDTYAFTDTAAAASLSIAAVNMLPCRPLDGGRVVHALLRKYSSHKAADAAGKISGVAFSCVLLGLFVYTCFHAVNFSLLFFALFALFGTLFTGRSNVYVKIFDNDFSSRIKRGAEIRRIAVSENLTVKRVIRLLDADALTEISVCSEGGKVLRVLQPWEVLGILSGDTLYDKMGKFC